MSNVINIKTGKALTHDLDLGVNAFVSLLHEVGMCHPIYLENGVAQSLESPIYEHDGEKYIEYITEDGAQGSLKIETDAIHSIGIEDIQEENTVWTVLFHGEEYAEMIQTKFTPDDLAQRALELQTANK